MTPQQQSAPTPKKVERPKTPISMNEKLETKNFLTVMILVTSVVVLVGGYFVYRLTQAYIRQANEVKAQDKLINSLKDKQEALEKLKPNYAAITTKGANNISDADLVLRALPTTEDYKSLIASLEQIGKESGVKVTTVTQSGGAVAASPTPTSTTPGTPAASSTAAQPQALAFSVNIEGPYERIFVFLQNTERSARVMNFTSMTLSGNSGTVSASLSMKTYWQAPANIASTMEPLK